MHSLLNNKKVPAQKSYITTLLRLQEVLLKKQMSNFAKYTIVSDMQFLGQTFLLLSNEFKIATSLSFVDTYAGLGPGKYGPTSATLGENGSVDSMDAFFYGIIFY